MSEQPIPHAAPEPRNGSGAPENGAQSQRKPVANLSGAQSKRVKIQKKSGKSNADPRVTTKAPNEQSEHAKPAHTQNPTTARPNRTGAPEPASKTQTQPDPKPQELKPQEPNPQKSKSQESKSQESHPHVSNPQDRNPHNPKSQEPQTQESNSQEPHTQESNPHDPKSYPRKDRYSQSAQTKLFVPVLFLVWAFVTLMRLFLRQREQVWVFGRYTGVGGGTLEVAREVRAQNPEATLFWACETPEDFERAEANGFIGVTRGSFEALWAIVHAHFACVSCEAQEIHPLGVFWAKLIQVNDYTPLEKGGFARAKVQEEIIAEAGGEVADLPQPPKWLSRGFIPDLITVSDPVSARRAAQELRVPIGRIASTGNARLIPLLERLSSAEGMRECKRELLNRVDIDTCEEYAPIILCVPAEHSGRAAFERLSEREQLSLLKQIDSFNGYLILTDSEAKLMNEFIVDHVFDSAGIRGGFAELLAGKTSGQRHVLSKNERKEYKKLLEKRTRYLSRYALSIDMLAGFDAVVTDYASEAIDFSVTGKPVFWVSAPGSAPAALYEPIEVTARGKVARNWAEVVTHVKEYVTVPTVRRAERLRAQALGERFHPYETPVAARNIVDAARQLVLGEDELLAGRAMLVECRTQHFYESELRAFAEHLLRELSETREGAEGTENPAGAPASSDPPTVYWVMNDVEQPVPAGAIPVLFGSRLYSVLRKRAEIYCVDTLKDSADSFGDIALLRSIRGSGRKQRLVQFAPARICADRFLDARAKESFMRPERKQVRKWNAVISASPDMTEDIRDLFQYAGVCLEVGSALHEVFARAERERNWMRARSARAQLGLDREAKVITVAAKEVGEAESLAHEVLLQMRGMGLRECTLLLVRLPQQEETGVSGEHAVYTRIQLTTEGAQEGALTARIRDFFEPVVMVRARAQGAGVRRETVTQISAHEFTSSSAEQAFLLAAHHVYTDNARLLYHALLARVPATPLAPLATDPRTFTSDAVRAYAGTTVRSQPARALLRALTS